MKNNFIVFSDFDGTISKKDILDQIIIDNSSFEEYKNAENKLLNGELIYEKYLFTMFDGINYNLNNISDNLIDDYFKEFYFWLVNNNIDFYIVSSGFKNIIQHLVPYVKSDIIYANNLIIDENNKWNVSLFDEFNKKSVDKNCVIKNNLKPNFKTVFIGDGLSDFKVMGNVDYLFCKKNSLLHNKCINENCNHIVFNDFNDVIQYLINL